MSKKNNVITPGICHNNLWSTFKSYLVRKKKEAPKKNPYIYGYGDFWDDEDYEAEMEKLRMYYGYEFDDDWYVDDDGAIVYPPKKKEGETAKVIDIKTPYSGFEEEPDEVEEEEEKGVHTIYFYPDFKERSDYEKFDSLQEFDDYCKILGVYVPDDVAQNITYWSESHCCIYPDVAADGHLEILAQKSYDDLWYDATYVESNNVKLW